MCYLLSISCDSCPIKGKPIGEIETLVDLCLTGYLLQ